MKHLSVTDRLWRFWHDWLDKDRPFLEWLLEPLITAPPLNDEPANADPSGPMAGQSAPDDPSPR